MDVKEVMSIDVNNLTRKQYEVFKNHMLSVASNLIEAIEQEDMTLVDTFTSPAGDCMGLDNTCINFTYGEDDILDIEEAFNLLLELRAKMQ